MVGRNGYLNLIYKHVDAGNGNKPLVYMYLEVKPRYIACKAGSCAKFDHTFSIYVSGGGAKYVRGDAKDDAGCDPDLAANVRKGLYAPAFMVDLNNPELEAGGPLAVEVCEGHGYDSSKCATFGCCDWEPEAQECHATERRCN